MCNVYTKHTNHLCDDVIFQHFDSEYRQIQNEINSIRPLFLVVDFEVYLKSKIIELQMKQAVDANSDHEDYFVDDGLCSSTERKDEYSQMEPMSKRKSLANDSKASVYFTPAESIDQNQLQLSPIHINYIRENLDSYMGYMKPAPSTARKLFFQQRQMCSADDDGAEPTTSRTFEQTYSNRRTSIDDDSSETESAIMIATENDSSNEDNCAAKPNIDYIPMNIFCKRKSKICGDSRDLYYSLENVFETKSPPVQLINDLTVDETSTSASDNCTADDENMNKDWATNGKVTPEKEIPTSENQSGSTSRQCLNHVVESETDFNELYASNSLPNIKRTVSALAEVHCSKDYNGTHVILAIEPSNTQKQSNGFGLNAADENKQIIESA